MSEGNSAHVEAGDYDGDGDIDLYVGSFDQASGSYKHYLFNNDMGRYKDVSVEAGITHTGKESSAIFTDFDNDGFLDIYVVREGGDILYRNTGPGTFEDVTSKSHAGSPTGGNMALFFDMDHDGDLDYFEGRSTTDLLFQNNADGTFQDQSQKLGLAGKSIVTTDAAFGDFDEDGDIDFIVTNENAGNILYSNQRQGVFKDITESCGLKSEGGSGAVTVGDYDNDGYLDLFIASLTGGKHMLYRNLRNGNFEEVKNSSDVFSALKNVKALDAAFSRFRQ